MKILVALTTHFINIRKFKDSNYEFRKLITKGKESIKKGNKKYIDAEIADTETPAIEEK